MALDYKSSLSRYRRYLQSVHSQPLWAASMWVVLSLILLIILMVLALRPTLVTISTLLGQIQQQKEISQKLEDKTLSVTTALKTLDSVKEKLPLLDEALPDDANWEDLVSEVESIATGGGIVIKSITVDKIPKALVVQTDPAKQPTEKPLMPEGVIGVKFELKGSGTYEQIRNTVSAIEKMSRLVIFKEVIISLNKEGGLELTITAEVGYLPKINSQV